MTDHQEEEEFDDPFHIGNLVSIKSSLYGTTTGRIFYRDDSLVRIIPQESSDRAIEFPLDSESQTFRPELGVLSVSVLEKHTSDFFVDVIGAQPGETLEFFNANGEIVSDPDIVSAITKSEDQDSITLASGKTLYFRGNGLEFNGVGPEPPIVVIRVRASTNMEVQDDMAEEEQQPSVEDNDDAEQMLRTLVSSFRQKASVEYIPVAEQTFPDTMQREEMLTGLLMDMTKKQKSNPRRIRFVEREVDVLLSLKRAVLVQNEYGTVVRHTPNIETVQDAVRSTTEPLSAVIPIVKAARVLNVDRMDTDKPYKESDVYPRVFAQVESNSERTAKMYMDGAAGGESNGLYTYLYDLLGKDQQTLHSVEDGGEWKKDQDVLRTAEPELYVEGFQSGLPSSFKKDDNILNLDLLSQTISNRMIRVLSSDIQKRRNQNRIVLAPSDPAKVSGYIVLPILTALELRPPEHSGILASSLLYSANLERSNQPTMYDILFGPSNIYSNTERSPNGAWTLHADDMFSLSELLKTALPNVIHPSDSLSARSPHILNVLDTLGLGKRDMSPTVYEVISNWVEGSQLLWSNRLHEMTTMTTQSIERDSAIPREFYGLDSPVWKSILETPSTDSFGELIADIRTRNDTIKDSPSVLTAAFQKEAQGDASPLVWSRIAQIDGRAPPIDPILAAESLAASRRYALLHKTIQNIELLRHRAAPILSTCPHAKSLEAIRNVDDVLKRSRILREFIEQYQGGRNGEWMTCALCKEHCVCYHEIMELEALAQPTRLETIMKQLFVRYGGEKYQGHIICRNCGQSIQAIEYDEHVEFDDDGKPIPGRSVLTDEQKASPSESIWKETLGVLTENKRTFNNEDMNLTADALDTLLRNCGIASLPEDVFHQIVIHTSIFMKSQIPTVTTYTLTRERALKSATTKLNISKGTPQVPSYEAIQDQTRITSILSLLALAIQTASPPVEVNKQASPCPYGATGWPLDSDREPKNPSDPKDVGALSYVACVAASITEHSRPWSNSSWFNLSTMEARPKKALELAVKTMKQILSGQAIYGSIPFTPSLLTTLEKTRQDATTLKNRALMSKKDVLPHRFRPDADIQEVSFPVLEKTPLPNVRKASPDMIHDIASAVQQMSLATVYELHTSAAESPMRNSPFCCPATIPDAAKGVIQSNLARDTLLHARRLLQESIPSSPHAGAHLWPVLNTVEGSIPEPSIDEGVYFKLFLKYCYRRAQVGELHEFSVGNICRRCGLALGKPLDLIDFNTEGATILAAQQGDLRVEITAESFAALSDAIRRKKILKPTQAAKKTTWKEGLARIVSYMKAHAPFHQVGSALSEVVAHMEETEKTVPDELARITLWEPITNMYDSLQANIADQIGPLVPTGSGKAREARAKEAANALRIFESITKDPFVEGPHAIQEYWCSKTVSRGNNFGVTSVYGAKWFKISAEHNAKLDMLLKENVEWYNGDTSDGIWKTILKKIGNTLGPLMRIWIQHIRPSNEGDHTVWTRTEAQRLLRTCVYQVWNDAIVSSSWMYGEIEQEDTRVEVAAKLSNWTRGLMLHVKHQYIKYSKEEISLKLQQRAEMERTSIVEEFGSSQDDDSRVAALLMKTFKIGRWAVGKNIQKYDPEMFEFENEQRARMGVVDPPVDPSLVQIVEVAAEDYGLGGGGGDEEGYDFVHDASDDM
jgi:hypothetical protein